MSSTRFSRADSSRPNVAFGIVEGVFLIAHSESPPSDVEWDRLVTAFLDAYQKRQHGRTLVTSEGGAPTAAQRDRLDKRIREMLANSSTPQGRVAILSRSVFVRSVVTASMLLEDNWFTRAAGRQPSETSRVYRSFLPTEIAQALAWLGTPREHHASIEQGLKRLRAEVS